MNKWDKMISSAKSWSDGKTLNAKKLIKHENMVLALSRYYSLALGDQRSGVLDPGVLEIHEKNNLEVTLNIKKNIIVVTKNHELLLVKKGPITLQRPPGEPATFLFVTQKSNHSDQLPTMCTGEVNIIESHNNNQLDGGVIIGKLNQAQEGISLEAEFIPEMINTQAHPVFKVMAEQVEEHFQEFLNQNPEQRNNYTPLYYPPYFKNEVLKLSTQDWLLLQWRRIKTRAPDDQVLVLENIDIKVGYHSVINTIKEYWAAQLNEPNDGVTLSCGGLGINNMAVDEREIPGEMTIRHIKYNKLEGIGPIFAFSDEKFDIRSTSNPGVEWTFTINTEHVNGWACIISDNNNIERNGHLVDLSNIDHWIINQESSITYYVPDM